MSFLLRFFDLVLGIIGLILLWPLLLLLYLIGLFDTGVPLLHQDRVGRFQHPFVLIKFRTMRLDTDHLASHLISSDAVTPFGSFLRRNKLDELPQLWNVVLGQMSLVGPRPGLLNQIELTLARTEFGVYDYRPGITGLAQITGIDMSTPRLLAQTDAHMLRTLNIFNYFRYIFLTLIGRGRGDALIQK